jgi:hypothetical protein
VGADNNRLVESIAQRVEQLHQVQDLVLRVDIFLAVGADKNIFVLFEPELPNDL